MSSKRLAGRGIVGLGARLCLSVPAAALGLGLAALPSAVLAQTEAADLVLENGKIVTVDERFRIAEAVAISGERIVAVGTNAEAAARAAPSARTIDLEGATVLPGLIDNHIHLLRAGTTWLDEVRLDGVETRRGALARIAERALRTPAGDWITTLGGFTVDQFADDDRAFTTAELDGAAPDHPVLLQASYYRGYLNTRALAAFGLDADTAPAWALRDGAGELTGEIEEAGIRALAARLPAQGGDALRAGAEALIRDLNRSGLTAVGSVGCPGELLEIYREWADQGRLDLRIFCIDGPSAGSPAQVDRVLPQIAAMTLFQGDHWIDRVAYGEGVYGPLHDPMFAARASLPADELEQWRRMAAAIARAGLPLHVHANFRATIDAFLDQIEQVHRETPVRNLRWAFAHANELDAAQIERMQALGMYAAVHPWAVINGGINLETFGDAALEMPPLGTLQASGITWGFGSDGTRANQILPFVTLSFAVTGRMVGGREVLTQPIDREDALIAHTRKNAYLIFQEDRLGSIEPGKLADLVVLDRDYLTVPAAEIADIEPVMTLVGGRIVHDRRADRR
jgi:hypothetical protein